MRPSLLAGLVALLVLLPSPRGHAADLPGEADRTAIRAVIDRQFQAFARDDGAAAFALASPAIRTMFGSAERFMTMVRQAYPAVHHHRSAEFEALINYQGRPAQRVRLVGADGKPVMALYLMARQSDDSWLIDGCVLTTVDELAM